MFQKNKLLLVLAPLTLLLFASGLQAQPKAGGTLVMSLQANPVTLNPAVQSGLYTGYPGAQLFASPLRYDENWNPQPYLAKSWETSKDGKTVTLELVENATFHDGQPITSADLAFSLETTKKYHPFKTMFEPVLRVETPSKHRVVVILSKPHPALLLSMSSILLPILPKHIYGDGQDVKKHPRNLKDVVGSGPFMLEEYTRDQHIILKKNPNFFLPGLPYLDKVVMRIMRDSSSRVIAIENGELHLSANENIAQNIKRLKRNKNLSVTDKGYEAIGPLTWLAFNHAKGRKTADLAVRQAIAYALDKKFFTKGIQRGIGTRADTGIHPGGIFFEPEVETYEQDINTANKLLDDAGYAKDSDGYRFALTIDFGWPEVRPHAEYTKAQLKKIGIKATVRVSPDFATWAKRVGGHDFDLTWDTVFNWGDPVIGVARTYLTSNIRKGVIWSNTQSYSNPKVDQLLEQAAVATEPKERKRLYSQFQKITAEELPVYWVATEPYHTISNKKVGNVPVNIWGILSPLDQVYLK